MRWLPRVAVAFVLSAFAIVALTWAGWPGPRFTVRLDADSRVGFTEPYHGPDPRYRLIQQTVPDRESFWFLKPDGTLRGPWRPGRPTSPLGFDAAGRFLAVSFRGRECPECPPAATDPFLLSRHDPETGGTDAVVALDLPKAARPPDFLISTLNDQTPSVTELSRDLSTLAVAAGEPLGIDIYDVADGRRRARLAFPGRDALPRWELSPDGRELLLSDARGVEAYEVATGRLARRVPPPGDAPRPSGPPPDNRYRSEFRVPVATHGGGELWLRVPMAHASVGPAAYRVVDGSGAADPDWQPLPGVFARADRLKVMPQPGRPAVVYRHVEQVEKPRDRRLYWFLSREARYATRGVSTYLYHDWFTGEFREFQGVSDGWQSCAVGPRDFAAITSTETGGTLKLWDLPPPTRTPWRWSVPAGVALGALLTAAGVRLRRRGASRPARGPPRPPPA